VGILPPEPGGILPENQRGFRDDNKIRKMSDVLTEGQLSGKTLITFFFV